MLKAELGNVDSRVELAARAICQALREDSNAMKPTGKQKNVSDERSWSSEPELAEAWRFHVAEAKKLTAVFDALSNKN